MKCLSRALLAFGLSLCLAPDAAEPPLILAQGLPGRLPGTLPGREAPAAPQPAAPAPVAAAGMPAACCDITAIDKAKSLVSARERASGRIVEFKVGNSAVLQKLQVGQAVHANFDAKQVSVDGKTMCCAITSVAAAPAMASKAPPPSLAGQKPMQPPQAQPPAKTAAAEPAKPMGAPQGLPGQKTPGQPSAAGPLAQGPMGRQAPDKTPGSTPSQPMGMGPGRTPGTPGGPPSGPGAGAGLAGGAAGAAGVSKAETARTNEPVPQVTAGTIRPAQTPGGKVVMQLPVRARNPNILELKGIDEIRGAPGLRQEAKDFLVLHARTLDAEDHDGYIVNRQLAEEWFKKNPVPASANLNEAAKDKGKKKQKGCSTKHISTGCIKKEVKDSVDDLTRAWRKAYSDTTDEVGRAWNKAQNCFTDHTLPTLKVPVKFAVTPEFPVNVSKGNMKGNVTVGVPIAGDFVTELKLFYIPCLPFAVRPKTLGADGTMESGSTLRANLTLTGEFDHTLTVPPNGVKIPIQIIPIVIGGVPVAEMDISVYVEGNVKIHGKGTLNGEVKLQSTQKTRFDFECSGHGCDLRHKGMPTAPGTAMESIKLDGTLHVKPAIYTALQLSFNWELLEARAGPQPFLLGELYGCAAASATQSTSGASSSTASQSIVADLDWGLDIRAEAFAANKEVAHKKFKIDVSPGTTGKNAHLYFKDLLQSTGLIPVVAGAAQVPAGQPAAFMITMPECYPYRDAQDNTLQYKVTWTGGASGSAGAAGAPDKSTTAGLTKTSGASPSSTCTFLAGEATCTGAPKANTALNLTWPASGDYVLTVAPVSDKHGHKFDASRAKQINVKVQ